MIGAVRFLLPLAHIRLETATDPEAVRKALRAAIDADVGFLPWLAPWTGRSVAGTVSDPWFRLISRTKWRDFYLPVTEGAIRSSEAGTVVEGVLRPKLTDLACVVLFTGVMLTLVLANRAPIWIAAAMAGLIHLAGCWGFARARRKVEALLASCAEERHDEGERPQNNQMQLTAPAQAIERRS